MTNGTTSLVARRVSGPNDAAAEQVAHVQVGGLVLPFPQAVASLWHVKGASCGFPSCERWLLWVSLCGLSRSSKCSSHEA